MIDQLLKFVPRAVNLPRGRGGGVVLLGLAAAASVVQGGETEWPFYKPREVETPTVQDQARVRNPIDAFVLWELEDRNLSLAPEASRPALLRRLYFDLIGLPPTPEQLADFIDDEDPGAYENLVDRLLGDPRYGERWGRFWLDLARYADTAGFEGDPDLPWAWRYRDYVIDSFNRDKRYDLFIKEQIAGDEFDEIMGAGELPVPKPEQVVALTFLRLAPFTEPRGDETRHEMLSEMTSTVSSVFLGLTVGCAKCHDHKYDRIPTKDFYRMKAFFSTVQIMPPERGDGLQIGGPLPAAFYREGEQEWVAHRRAELEKESATSGETFAAYQTELRNRLNLGGAGFTIQTEGGSYGNNYVYDQAVTSDGEVHFTIVNSDGQRWQYFSDGLEAAEMGALVGSNQGHWFGDLEKPEHLSLGQYTGGTPEIADGKAQFRGKIAEIMIYGDPLDENDRQKMVVYLDGKYRGGTPGEPPGRGLRFSLDASDLDGDPATPNPVQGARVEEWVDRVGRLKLRKTTEDRIPTLDVLGPGAAPAVRFDDDFLVGALGQAAFLEDQRGALVVVYSAQDDRETYGMTVGGNKMHFSVAISNKRKGSSLEDVINEDADPRLTAEERRRYRVLSTRGDFIKQHLKRLQPMAMSLRHAHGPPYEPGVPTSRVMIRGEYDNPGEVVEAGFLSCITGNQEPAKIRLDPFKRWPTRSRRMALAQWIASSENPLTARVMMNRLWYHHFGRGIVETPSDFGKLSGGPSHRELLDWLALCFVEKKWSLKAMHKLMVTSSTYRQSSQRIDEQAELIDPDNQFLWRFNRRRLEAEAVRDAVLAVSGRLHEERYGLPIFPALPDGMEERVKYSKSKWATDLGALARKRSVYIYQQRTLTMPFMQTFDGLVCEDTIPRRRSSVTPLQALAMYNGEFVNEEAEHFAARVAREAGEDPDRRVAHAIRLAFGRFARPEEISELREYAQSERGLRGLCRILYNANEFVYVD